MTNITNLFGGDFVPPSTPTPERLDPPGVQFIDAIMSQGYEAPSTIIFDGQIHRFSSSGKKRDDSGWYVAYDGKIHAGAFGCWREGSNIPWRENIGREFTPMEEMEHANRMKEIRKKAEEARHKKQETAADTSVSIWESASDASDDHPYLKAKGVKCHGLKITGDGRLIIPRWDENGEIASLQFIDQHGDKKFKAGGKSSGTFYCVGHISSQTTTVYLAEGYATAATIHETTGQPCFVAFNAGNLAEVAKIVRANYPGDLCIVADHDSINANTGKQEGIYRADEAAKETRARVVYPPIEGMDANDYAQAGYDLLSLLTPAQASSDYLISADDFCKQPAPIKWMIKGVLQKEALIMVHGPSGGGKTFAVLDMCLHVAAGLGEWFGHKVTPGTVVYLAGEGHAGLRARVAAWNQYHGADRLNMWISKAGTDLNKPEGLQLVMAAIDAIPDDPVIIVVDTLHRFMHGDENSAQDAKEMLDACAVLQSRYRSSVLLVHHTGVSEEAQHRARGSSAWRGALENEFSVVPMKDDEPMQIIARKMKDSELPAPIYAKLETVGINGWFDEDGEQVTSAILKASDNNNIKSDPKAEKFKLEFLEAWSELGKERRAGGCHYITNSALKDWLVSKGKTERTAKNYVDPSRKTDFMGYLKSVNMADRYDAGWILFATGDDAANALLGGLNTSP